MIEVERILVCGPRKWPVDLWLPVFNVIAGIKKRYGIVTIVHGAARGIDTMAGEFADILGLGVEPYPADWSMGGGAGPVRNRQMLETGIDLVIAIGYGRGTANCVAQARGAFNLLVIWRYPSLSFDA